jgi:hypothetical protein
MAVNDRAFLCSGNVIEMMWKNGGVTWEGGDEGEPAGEVGVGVRRREVVALEGSPAKQVSQGAEVSDDECAECKAGIQVVKKGGDGGSVVRRGQVQVGVDLARLRGREVWACKGRGWRERWCDVFAYLNEVRDGGEGVGRGVREREGNGGKSKRADDAKRLQGTYHAFASEKLSGIHVHDTDVGSRYVTCRNSVLVDWSVKRSKDGIWEVGAAEADAAWFLLITGLCHCNNAAIVRSQASDKCKI